MADDFTKKIMRELSDAMHEQMAQSVASVVREEGLASADQVKISTETDDPSMPVDAERVRRRANQILGR